MACHSMAPSHYLNQYWPGMRSSVIHMSVVSHEMSKISITAICLKTGHLTHRGRVTYICVSKLIIIGSDNGLSPRRRQAIIWTNAGILLIGPLGTNFNEILCRIQTFSLKEMHLKPSSAKWRPFCLCLNVLILQSGANELMKPMKRNSTWKISMQCNELRSPSWRP